MLIPDADADADLLEETIAAKEFWQELDLGADTSSPRKPKSVTDKGKHDEDGVSARMPVRILMVCNGADEGALSDGEQDADAMALAVAVVKVIYGVWLWWCWWLIVVTSVGSWTLELITKTEIWKMWWWEKIHHVHRSSLTNWTIVWDSYSLKSPINTTQNQTAADKIEAKSTHEQSTTNTTKQAYKQAQHTTTANPSQTLSHGPSHC